MRQVKFRGLRHNGEWVYGGFVTRWNNRPCIVQYNPVLRNGEANSYDDHWDIVVDVYEDTVSQFTGLTDRNGKDIYVGDILQWTENGHKSRPMAVVEKYGAFGYLYYGFHSFVGNDNLTFHLKGTDSRFEIIGNIYNTPELIL